jgi:predicted ABC-class ATPase
VAGSLFFERLDRGALYRHVETNEDADYLRGKLREMGLAAFIADGAVLPRRSGVDPRPLTTGRVIPFQSPPSLRVEVELPNRGRVTGMGIPVGITLIVGGGYHGKSTVLNALELGVYNHVPGDGRELVVADPGAVKIRAEDGRRIEKVDISTFIRGLPFGQDTTAFCTDNASGSTSQAANIIEALEVGATLLLIDEDTSATNFMIRDERMQKLVPKEFEPITPFIDKAGQLFRDYGVSVILVIGGSGATSTSPTTWFAWSTMNRAT